jgi:hypothetical protein
MLPRYLGKEIDTLKMGFSRSFETSLLLPHLHDIGFKDRKSEISNIKTYLNNRSSWYIKKSFELHISSTANYKIYTFSLLCVASNIRKIRTVQFQSLLETTDHCEEVLNFATTETSSLSKQVNLSNIADKTHPVQLLKILYAL